MLSLRNALGVCSGTAVTKSKAAGEMMPWMRWRDHSKYSSSALVNEGHLHDNLWLAKRPFSAASDSLCMRFFQHGCIVETHGHILFFVVYIFARATFA